MIGLISKRRLEPSIEYVILVFCSNSNKWSMIHKSSKKIIKSKQDQKVSIEKSFMFPVKTTLSIKHISRLSDSSLIPYLGAVLQPFML